MPMLLPHSGAVAGGRHVRSHVLERRVLRRRRRRSSDARSAAAAPTSCASCARSRPSARARRRRRARRGRCRRRAASSSASVTMHAISTITCCSTSRPVISRSIHTSRSSSVDARSRRPRCRTLPARGARVDSAPMTAPAVVWRPDADAARATATSRASWRPRASPTSPTLVARSIDEPEWFWDAVVRFLGIRVRRAVRRRCSTRRDGIPWAKWFTGGRCNLAIDVRRPSADDPRRATARRRLGGRRRRRPHAHVARAAQRSPIASRRARGARRAARATRSGCSCRWCPRRSRRCSRSRSSARSSCRSSPATAPTRSRSGSRTRTRSRSSPPTASRGAARSCR